MFVGDEVWLMEMKKEINEITFLTKRTLLSLGFNEEDANITTEVLLYAELRGNNQGKLNKINK